MSAFEPPTGPPVPGVPAPRDPMEIAAERYMAMMQEMMSRRGQQIRNPEQWFKIFLGFGPATAVAVCAAMAYMEQDLIEDDDATAAAHDLFFYIATCCRDLLLPVLAQRGIASVPELWLENWPSILEAINELLGVDEEEDLGN